MSVTQPSRKSARERILDTATQLFYQDGIQNVGVDRIIAESGVAKMSLYNHFKSKDALIEAVLRQRDQHWCHWFVTQVEQHSSDPKEQLLAVFDVLQEWMEQPEFRGCAFMNATVELANPEHPGYQAAVEHKQKVAHYLLHLTEAAGLASPEAIAQQLLLLVEGAIAVAMIQEDPTTARVAKQVAAMLLAAPSDHPLLRPPLALQQSPRV